MRQLIEDLISAMEYHVEQTRPIHSTTVALQAAREALRAQPAPVQEPLEYWNAVEGWVKIDEVREHFDSVGCGTIYKNAGDGRVPLTAAQRQWVGLTDEDIEQEFGFIDELLRDCVHRTEAKVREKNNG